jgi:hypothetical protein
MDLIPEDYRRSIEQMQLLQRWGLAILVYLGLAVAISFGLNYMADRYQQDIEVLEKKKAISSHQRGILQELEKERSMLMAKREVLEKLRGGALAEDMFVNIDKALTGNDVWFKSWSFVRAGSKTREEDKGVNTGYFIVIPKGERTSKKDNEAWKIQVHMEISGQATDHEALSSFVRRVIQQPQIADVRILNTQKRDQNNSTVVDFKLVVMVNSGHTNS